MNNNEYDRCILTGLHSSGKSTFLTDLMRKNHINMIRLNIIDALANFESFDLQFYLNFFTLYDRFFPIDIFVYYKMNELICKLFFKKYKKCFDKSIFIFLLFNFKVELTTADSIEIESYKKIIAILRNLHYNVLVFDNKTDWIEWSRNADLRLDTPSGNSNINLYPKAIDTRYLEFFDMCSNIYLNDLVRISWDEKEILKSEEYKRYVGIKKHQYI